MSNELQFLLYNMPDDNGKVQVVVKDETIWCTQKAMSQLFGVDRTVITKHLKNIFESTELVTDSVCAKFAHTADNGKDYLYSCRPHQRTHGTNHMEEFARRTYFKIR